MKEKSKLWPKSILRGQLHTDCYVSSISIVADSVNQIRNLSTWTGQESVKSTLTSKKECTTVSSDDLAMTIAELTDCDWYKCYRSLK